MADVKLSNSNIKSENVQTPEKNYKKTTSDNNNNSTNNSQSIKENSSPSGPQSNNRGHMKKRKLNSHNNTNNNGQQSEYRHNSGAGNNTGSGQDRLARNSNNYNGSQHLAGHRLTGSPVWDLQPQNTSAQTFTGRCRLFVANLPSNVTEDSLRKLFSEFGQISDIFIGKGNQFAFIKMDTRSNAETAKNTLDGKPFEGRTLRVRLAAHAAAIKVSNLPPFVSNELLHYAFSTFGPIERAIVVADDRGRSLNEGIIEFARKSSAHAAIKKCQNECLLLSSSPIPVVATSLESRDEEEGVPEKNLLHNSVEYRKEREIGPRFSEPNTVEHEIAKKWKEFILHETEKRAAFEESIQEMHEKFKLQMEYFRLEESTKQLREELIQMQTLMQQFNAERESRYDYERQREDQRRQQETVLRQQEEQLIGQHNQNDINILRRQESDLRQQANTLQQLLDRQEKSLRQMDPAMGQHIESNMYNQTAMHGQQAPIMPAGQMPQAPAPMPSIPPYPPQIGPQVNYSPQQPPHQQMNQYAHHQMPQAPPPPQMNRASIVPFNGVPPNMGHGLQTYVPQQTTGGPGAIPTPNTYPQVMNHAGNGGGGGGGGNFGKRTRRY